MLGFRDLRTTPDDITTAEPEDLPQQEKSRSRCSRYEEFKQVAETSSKKVDFVWTSNGTKRGFWSVEEGYKDMHYPIYFLDTSIYAENFIQEAHETTLHGGVGLTMARIREHHWIPRLRRLVKRIVNRCPGCKRLQATAVASPPPALLPRDRTEGTTPFEVIGVDYAGPLSYKAKGKSKKEDNAYLLLYTCSLSRAVYLEILPTLETQEFIRSLREFVARWGRPRKIYSDNGGTFVGAAKWLRIIMHDEKFNDFFVGNEILWQFNLSPAPWWGGKFERLVGLVKRALHKTIGRRFLTWDELREVILDVEVAVSSRPPWLRRGRPTDASSNTQCAAVHTIQSIARTCRKRIIWRMEN